MLEEASQGGYNKGNSSDPVVTMQVLTPIAAPAPRSSLGAEREPLPIGEQLKCETRL